MPLPKDVYTKCDELDGIPQPNRENWLYEITLLKKELTPNAKVLQVGCMDGTRILAILKERPDLIITGLDVDKNLIDIAKKKFSKSNVEVSLIHEDITKPLSIGMFDYVICLNNTLGYISDEQKAIENMMKLGKIVILSVYGGKFTNQLAREYFKSINLEVEQIEKNIFHIKEFVDALQISRFRFVKIEIEDDI